MVSKWQVVRPVEDIRLGFRELGVGEGERYGVSCCGVVFRMREDVSM